jgi:HKD family nuclease
MPIQVASTWPASGLLPAIRRALTGADEALLCVAFLNQKGIHLLEPELTALGSRCRVVVTSVFSEPAPALAQLTRWGNEVRVLNPRGGTFHPKLYLASHGSESQAFIGSANLISGLLTNIELGVLLSGARAEPPVAEAWDVGEAYWSHERALPWTEKDAPSPTEAMAPSLVGAIRRAIPQGTTIHTLAGGKPNTITDITELGVWVQTMRSGEASQLVEAWMLELACEVLLTDQQLTNHDLLNTLHVHRSSAVCAILAQLPEVEVESPRPIRLRLATRPAWADAFLSEAHAGDR